MEKKIIWNAIIDKNVNLRVNHFLLKNRKTKVLLENTKKETKQFESTDDETILKNIKSLLELKNYKEINYL